MQILKPGSHNLNSSTPILFSCPVCGCEFTEVQRNCKIDHAQNAVCQCPTCSTPVRTPLGIHLEFCRSEASKRGIFNRRSSQDNLIRTIQIMVATNDGRWTGNMSGLLTAGRQILHVTLADNPRQLSCMVADVAPVLETRYGIRHEYIKNGGGGGKHRFFYLAE